MIGLRNGVHTVCGMWYAVWEEALMDFLVVYARRLFKLANRPGGLSLFLIVTVTILFRQ